MELAKYLKEYFANSTPEVMPDVAKEVKACILATGRSDFSNQFNN